MYDILEVPEVDVVAQMNYTDADDVPQNKVGYNYSYFEDVEDVDPPSVIFYTLSDEDCNISSGNASADDADDIDIHAIDMVVKECHNPKAKKRKELFTPVSMLIADKIGCCQSRKLLRVLFDSGATTTMINKRVVPDMATPKQLKDIKEINTLAGKFSVSEMVRLEDLRLPEFDKNRRIQSQKALIFDRPSSRYDMILGSDFLHKVGIDISYKRGVVEWYGNTIPLRDPLRFKDSDYDAIAEGFMVQHDDEFIGDDWMDCYVSQILDAKYERVDIDDVIKSLSHLTESQKEDLRNLLSRHTKLFDGTLGVYPHEKFHIDIEPGAKPVHSRPYPVPRVHLETFKKELDHLVKIGVLEYQGNSEWACGTFIVPKKDGRVRWISDLRALNKVVKRKQYPLPIINDILRKRTGYAFFSKLDISMQYYTFELDEESKDLCTIITPFGKFRYRRLPMGLKCSPDFAQRVMEQVLRGIEDSDFGGAEVYIDDIGAFSKSWTHHMNLLSQILTRLEENGFTVNPLKCEWAVSETDWLGYWLTPSGLKPWQKKVDAILKMQPPTNLKELRSFIGAVNYYRDMWPSRAHILAPLTSKTGKRRFEWTDEMNEAFSKMKAIIAADALTAYPNHNLPFHIYTDASDYQLGAAIVQDGRPVAYYSKKLTGAQRNYTTQEKELLSIVMTLKEYRSMLLGAELHVHTDHKNLTFENLTSQRVLRWRCFVEEYSPKFHFIAGPENVLADAYSRVPRAESLVGKNMPINDDVIDENYLEAFYSVLDEPDLLDCFLNLPTMNMPAENPLNMEWIREQQQGDNTLLEQAERYSDRYFTKTFDDDIEIICYVKPGGDPELEWKIALAQNMIQPTISWFHQVLGHPGSKRMRLTMQARYYHPEIRRYVDRYACDACQRHKLEGRGYGLLPERNLSEVPWQDVAVDLIGPWKIPINNRMYEFNALTCIDTVTNLTELVRIDNKTSAHVTTKFEQTWLARYPWPRNCIHDNGGEFTGWEFQLLLENLGIKDVPTTSRNPTANAICERMHQTVGNILRTMLHTNPPHTVTAAKEIVDNALATAMHAMRASISTTLGAAPGALVFSRDMFLNIPMIADWHQIAQRREQLVNESLRRQNLKRRRYDYVQGQRVLKKVHDPTKLGERTEGPYTIQSVHVNGTVTIELRAGVTERINIRRVIPYREP